MVKVRIKDLAGSLGCDLSGEGEGLLRGAASIEDAGRGDLTFLGDKRLKSHLFSTSASAVIVKEAVDRDDVTFIISGNPYLDFARALNILYPPEIRTPVISDVAFVDGEATVSGGVTIMPFAYVEKGAKIEGGVVLFPGVYVGRDSQIGENSVLYPSVTVYGGCSIGKNVIIHGGAVIGADGFGYARRGDEYIKIPQVGKVVIEDDVEIGANTTIDRAALGETRIKEGTKIDNIVQVGHNVKIGKNSIIASQAGVSGSVEIGDGVMLGGQAGVAGHLKIDPGIMVGAKSGIPSSLSSAKSRSWSGIPVMPHKKWLRLAVSIENLPDLMKKVRKLELELEKIKGKSGG